MRKLKWLSAAFLTFLVLGGFVSKEEQGVLANNSLSVAGDPEILGEGIISTQDDEFGGAITPDGKTIFFNKSVPQSFLYTICVSHLKNGKWDVPEIASFSGLYRDSDPVLSPDGSKLFFVSDRPVDGEDKKDFDVWYVDKTIGGWSEPKNIGSPINSDQNEYFVSQANNGTLYFTSARASNIGIVDVYRSRLVNGKYEEPVNLGTSFNGPQYFNIDSFVAPDESYLIVAGWGHDSLGDADLYISYREGETWSPLVGLGPKVNTAARDSSPRISADGSYFIFSSERGLPTEKRTSAITYGELMDRITGTLNGLGNIYRIKVDEVVRKR